MTMKKPNQTCVPKRWKIGTVNTLVSRAFSICSNDILLKEELNIIKKSFTMINNYPFERNYKMHQTNRFKTEK